MTVDLGRAVVGTSGTSYSYDGTCQYEGSAACPKGRRFARNVRAGGDHGAAALYVCPFCDPRRELNRSQLRRNNGVGGPWVCTAWRFNNQSSRSSMVSSTKKGAQPTRNKS